MTRLGVDEDEILGDRTKRRDRAYRPPAQLTHNWSGQATITRGKKANILNNVGDGLPGVCTICLTRRDASNVAPDSANVDSPLVALVSFGLERSQELQVRCDWLNGTMLTVPSFNVGLVCEYPENEWGPMPLVQHVSAMVMPIARPAASGGISQARLTERFTLAADARQLLRVPARATALRLFTNLPNYYGSFAVGFQWSSSPVGRASYSMLPAGPSEEMPLGGGTRAVTVSNDSPVEGDFAVQWTISL